MSFKKSDITAALSRAPRGTVAISQGAIGFLQGVRDDNFEQSSPTPCTPALSDDKGSALDPFGADCNFRLKAKKRDSPLRGSDSAFFLTL